MKSQFSRFVLTAGLTLLGGLTLSAQDKTADAKIPFAFHANHTALAAGPYRIHLTDTVGTFELRDQDSGQSIFVMAYNGSRTKYASEGKLTFACYQGDCALAKIHLPNSDVQYVRSDSAINDDMQRKLGLASMVTVQLRRH